MTRIEVHVLGVPEVRIDGKTIEFPFKKAEALFYFLCFNKKTTRERLSSLLWSEHNDESARKNLRNAIYVIKRLIGEDVIITPNRSIVELNPDVKTYIDIDDIKSNMEDEVENFDKVLMDNFSLKDAPDFEDWLREKRDSYQKEAINKLTIMINNAMMTKDYKNAEAYLMKLIKIDSYNEEAYRQLMQLYREKGEIKKAIECYVRLKSYLDEELGIKPEVLTQRLYQSIKTDMELLNSEDKDPCFFGRTDELRLMKEKLELFKKKNVSQCIIIEGEAGVGKSALIQQFIKKNADDSIMVLLSYCYQAEENFCLRPWNIILEQLLKTLDKHRIKISPAKSQVLSLFFPALLSDAHVSDVNEMMKLNPLRYGQIIEIILELLQQAAIDKKLILILDDIQWADDQSIKLVYELLLRSRSIPIFFILSGRNENLDNKLKLLHALYLHNILEVIELKRLSMEETFEFCRFKLKMYEFDDALLEQIYKETEGNIFFIIEILNLLKEGKDINNLSNKMQSIMESRLSTVSKDGIQVLNIMSVFFDEVPYSILQELSGKEHMRLIRIIEELILKYLIKEEITTNGELAYRFTHIKIHEYIYSRLSASRKRFLHNRIALYLEEKYSAAEYDDRIVIRLIHHFYQSGNRLKELEYRIKRAKMYVCFGYELFPVIDDNVFMELENRSFDCDISEKQLTNIESLIIMMSKTMSTNPDFIRMESDFLAMQGSLHIQKGNYEDGIRMIERLINKAEKEGHINNLLKGLTQMCYYGIQTDNREILAEYAGKMYHISKKHNMHQEYGMALRFNGLLKLMESDYAQAENLFNESIRIFKSLETLYKKYTFSITAALNYIGDTRLFSGNNAEALRLYEKCIAMSEGRRNFMSMSLFCANAGHASFNMGNYDESGIFFEKSLAYLNEVKGGWVHPIANSFKALLLAYEGNYEGALHNLKIADMYCDRLKKKYWMGINYRVKAEIRVMMDKNENLKKYFRGYLIEKTDYYADLAIMLFNSVGYGYGASICRKFVI